jgi:abortive infection bacteriophage resistance protein
MSQPKTPFKKTWLSYADQVQLLVERGLVVADESFAEQLLAHLNYYRFSGYCLAFESERHTFVTGTTFEQVASAYEFDLKLRDLLTEALEVVEVDLRTDIAYLFGERYGAFGHTLASNFFASSATLYAPFAHADWLDRLREEADRSSELFVSHFRRTHSEFPDLPIWIATEVMSFGGLSKMFSGMLKKDQRGVAHRYGLQPLVLRKAMHHFVYIRNLCAHHSRLWDRVWNIKPELPAGKNWQPPLLPGNNRLFATLLLLRQMMQRIPAVQPFALNWKARVTAHLGSPPSSLDPLSLMGLTADWAQHPIWQ